MYLRLYESQSNVRESKTLEKRFLFVYIIRNRTWGKMNWKTFSNKQWKSSFIDIYLSRQHKLTPDDGYKSDDSKFCNHSSNHGKWIRKWIRDEKRRTSLKISLFLVLKWKCGGDLLGNKNISLGTLLSFINRFFLCSLKRCFEEIFFNHSHPQNIIKHIFRIINEVAFVALPAERWRKLFWSKINTHFLILTIEWFFIIHELRKIVLFIKLRKAWCFD